MKESSNLEMEDRNEESGEELEVEKILERRVLNGVVQYYLKWKGFGDDENTWEPETNLHCDILLEEFEKEKNDEEKKLHIVNRTDKDEKNQNKKHDNNLIMVNNDKDKTKLHNNDYNHNSQSASCSYSYTPVETYPPMMHVEKIDKSYIDSIHEKEIRNVVDIEKYWEKYKLKENIIDLYPNRIPEKIVSVSMFHDQVIYLLKWKDSEETLYITFKELKEKFPRILIKYCEQHFAWRRRDCVKE